MQVVCVPVVSFVNCLLEHQTKSTLNKGHFANIVGPKVGYFMPYFLGTIKTSQREGVGVCELVRLWQVNETSQVTSFHHRKVCCTHMFSTTLCCLPVLLWPVSKFQSDRYTVFLHNHSKRCQSEAEGFCTARGVLTEITACMGINDKTIDLCIFLTIV